MKPKNSLKLLGTLAVEKGWFSESQLESALDKQIDSPGKLGEILVDQGLLDSFQLEELIEIHTEEVFLEDELHFGRLAIKNKFVSKEDIDLCLQEQKGTNDLLGEILITKGLMTLQRCNAILKLQKRFLINSMPIEATESDAYISCPECKVVYKIKNPDSARDLHCNNCGMIFEMDMNANTIVHQDSKINTPHNTLEVEGTVQPGLFVQPSNSGEDGSVLVGNDFTKLHSYLEQNQITLEDDTLDGSQSSFISEERYDIGEEIDRGGMGLILATKDLNIKRDIVTKVLLSKNSKSKVLRFIREAQINGQLEHPNIVPIHDLGMNSNEQIYFTMKWVKGETLRSILENLDDKNSYYLERYTCQALVGIVQKVGDALAYAHSKNIIHRDLKPDNIMVGEFGEVQLMDWGLAKTLGTDEVVLERLEASDVVNDDVDLLKTMAGSCIGTPEYMAPEQAKGELDNMDERTDIYGLGGVLHSCLSLSTPIRGKTFNNVLLKVTSGRISALPKDTAPELVAIVKKAMALKSIDRYQSIKEFSTDLIAFQNGFSVSAKHDTLFEILGKLIKRNKAMSFGLMIAGLALIVGLIISIWQWNEAVEQTKIAESNFELALENERKIQLEKENGRINLEAEKNSQLKQKQYLSTESVKTGREHLSLARAINHKYSSQFAEEKSSELFNAANSFRQALIYNNDNKDAKKGLNETGKRHFELSLWLNSFEQAKANLSDIFLSGGQPHEMEKFQKDLETAKNEKVRRIRNRIIFLMNDAISLNRTIIHEAASKELISLRDKLTIELLKPYINSKLANCRKLAIDSLAWMGESHVARDILPYIQKKCPDGSSNNLEIQVSAIIAISILKPKSIEIYNMVRKRIWDEPNNTSSFLYQQIKLFHVPYAAFMANKVFVPLVDVKNARTWMERGTKYKEGNKLQKALECYSKAIELDPSSGIAYNNRGILHNKLGEYEKGVKDYLKAIQIDPKDVAAHSNLGSTYLSLNKFSDAIQEFNNVLKIDPKDIPAYNNRALVKKELGDLDGALADHDYVIELDPKNLRSYVNRGLVKSLKKDHKGAVEDYNIALGLNPRLYEAYANRGAAKHSLKDYVGAVSDFSKSIELKPNVVVNYYNRGIAKTSSGDLKGALIDFDRVLKLRSRYARTFQKRGAIKEYFGDFKGAFKDYSESVYFHPKRWLSWYGRAIVAYGLKKDKEFKESFNNVKEYHPNWNSIEKVLIKECKLARERIEGEALLNKDISLASDYFKRGQYYFSKSMFAEATADIKKAIQLESAHGLDGGYHKLISIAKIQNNSKKLLVYYADWMKAKPDNFALENELAWILLTDKDKKVNNIKLGLIHAIKAANLSDFKESAILDTLALAYFKNDKKEAAVKFADQALKLLPNNTIEEDRKSYEGRLNKYKSALIEAK
ncbi:MAG: hypothetical protein COA79_14135 [Planctomycetota bacterium]|nr:MAG: hypothetical protein COA79_14135 [Planctomycetota bacterium]